MNRHAYFRQQEKNELYHHGIKGQKWGIRRYQNPDGTLTPAGRARYGLNKIDDKDYSSYSLKKRSKMLGEEAKKIGRRINYNSGEIAQDLAAQREYEDKKKWSSNKDFKADVKKEALKYAKMIEANEDYDARDEQQEKSIKALTKKYPQAEELLSGLALHEHIGSLEDVKNIFSEHIETVEYNDGEMPIYISWLDHVLNNDFYYEPNDKDYEQEALLNIAANAEWEKELSNKYGQDAADYYTNSSNKKGSSNGKKIAGAIIGSALGAAAIGGIAYGAYKLSTDPDIKNAKEKEKEIKRKTEELPKETEEYVKKVKEQEDEFMDKINKMKKEAFKQ